MVDDEADIDAMGRKELQALAKTFGIKANQKSVVLRDMIREAIAQQEESSVCVEDSDAEDKQDQPESVVEDNLIVDEDVVSTKNDTEPHHSTEIELSHSPSTSESDEMADDSDRFEEANDAGEENAGEMKVDVSISDMNEVPAVTTDENDDLDDTTTVEVVEVEDVAIEKEHNINEAPDEDAVADVEDDKSEIHIGTNDSVGRQPEEINQQIETAKLTTSSDKKVLTTKISFDAEKSSIKKHSHSNIYKNEKFTSKLDESFRRSKEKKQVANSNLPKKVAHQPTEQKQKAKREVPLWKVHSRDFMRKRGTDKFRDLNSKKKNPSPTKHIQRRPFGDRSNNTVKTKTAKQKIQKNDVRRIPPKPQAMSKRNEEQMKLFVERQSVGKKEKNKRIPPKALPMSKRNEEQMKRFLERQSVGRKERERREEVRKHANYVRG